MNYDDVNKLSEYLIKEIFPLINSCRYYKNFAEYLDDFKRTKSGRWMRTQSFLGFFPLVYFVDPAKFLERHKNNIVCFCPSEKPEDGTMSVILQISPEFHVSGRIYAWIENNRINSYITPLTMFKDVKDYLQFSKDNEDLKRIGNTQEREMGYKMPMT